MCHSGRSEESSDLPDGSILSSFLLPEHSLCKNVWHTHCPATSHIHLASFCEKITPRDAALIKAMATTACQLKCSWRTMRPARAAIAGSRLSRTLKTRDGRCLSASISRE